MFKKPVEGPEKPPIHYRQVSRFSVDEKIQLIVSNKAALRECRKQAALVLKKRKERYMRLTRCLSATEFCNSNNTKAGSPTPSPQRPLSPEECEARRKNVGEKREELEEGHKMQLFLRAHSREINQMHVLSRCR